MKGIIVMLMLLLIPIVSADVWVSPANPTINGNNWVFVAYNTTASTAVNISIFDGSDTLKKECIHTTNERGYTTCKYVFDSTDEAGNWNYTIDSSISELFGVAKISINLTANKASVGYGDSALVKANVTYEGEIEKPIVARGISRDMGTHAGKSDMVDLDGDGDLEIVIIDYTGMIWVYENMSRLYNEGLMLITGTDWRSTDTGTKYLFNGCDYGDFDNDGSMTIICSDYADSQLEAFVDLHPSAARDVAPTFTGVDEGDSIRSEPIICDVTGDGIPDQVAVNIYDGTMIVYDFSDVTGFNKNYESADLGTGHYGTRALCDDFDGDGLNEWMLCIYDVGCRFGDVTDVGVTNQVVEGDAQDDHGAYYSHGGSGDFDGDGQVEYVVPNTVGRVEMHEFNTSGTDLIEHTIAWAADTDVGSYSYGGGAITVGDYNLNGRPDFIITDTDTQSWFYEYNPVTSGWNQTEVGQGYENTYVENAYVDFDGDGIKEIMAFGRYSGNTYIYRFNGKDWDRIYEGWNHDYGEFSGSGDGYVYASASNSWLYGLQCAYGDADGDGRDEAVCMMYQGKGIIYEEADRFEENVSAELIVTTETDGVFVLPVSVVSEEIRLHNSLTLVLTENVALGITDIVDEDNQNQGSINPRWTDGLTGTTTPPIYATLDASSVEEAVYSRIKLGKNYTVGAIRMWNYFGDGRGYKNVIVRGTSDDTGTLCDFSSNDLLFDNSADGMNMRYGEDNQGKSVYFSPVTMSCLRESTGGSSYWTTASDTANHRTEIQIFEALPYVPVKLYMDEEEDSDYGVGDYVDVNVSVQDFTGNLVDVVGEVSLPFVAEEVSNTFHAVIIENSASEVLIIQ